MWDAAFVDLSWYYIASHKDDPPWPFRHIAHGNKEKDKNSKIFLDKVFDVWYPTKVPYGHVARWTGRLQAVGWHGEAW